MVDMLKSTKRSPYEYALYKALVEKKAASGAPLPGQEPTQGPCYFLEGRPLEANFDIEVPPLSTIFSLSSHSSEANLLAMGHPGWNLNDPFLVFSAVPVLYLSSQESSLGIYKDSVGTIFASLRPFEAECFFEGIFEELFQRPPEGLRYLSRGFGPSIARAGSRVISVIK